MKKFVSIFVFITLAFPCSARFVPSMSLGVAWMDSTVAECIVKIGQAQYADQYNGGRPFYDFASGEMRGSHYIEIDVSKWTPNVVSNVFYYERASAPQFYTSSNSPWKIVDSLTAYHMRNAEATNYIPLYNIVLKNFPFPLQKDISKVKTDEGRNLFTQLQQIDALDANEYDTARQHFEIVIENVCNLAASLYSRGIVYGTANLLGQYGNKPQMRASFGAFCVRPYGFDTLPSWISGMMQIPKQLCPPIALINKPTVEQKNFEIATTIQHYIECNRYGNCIMSAAVFQNMYARWLFDNLKSSTVIDKTLLLATCLKLNGLSQEFAWAVLTVEYESGYDQYNETHLGNVYNSYTNGTLTRIQELVAHISRGQSAFKTQAEIGRDSALYYGWLLYRIPSYMRTIATPQRIHLIDELTNSSCQDIQGANEAGDYNNHCEQVCLSLCTNVPQIEERAFLAELKTRKLLWDLTYRIDNSTFGFFGKNNYSEFIFTISAQWSRAYPEKASSPQLLAIQWSDDFFNSNGAVTVNTQNNTITVYQKELNSSVTDPLHSYPIDVYSPVTIRIDKGDWLPGMNGVAVEYITVPAFFLDWLYHEKTLDDIGTTAHIALNVVALTVGVGEVYHAITWTMRIAYGIQVTMTALDWILMDEANKNAIIAAFPDTAVGRSFVNAYQVVSMAVNLTVAAKGLLFGVTDASATITAKYDENASALSSNLGSESFLFRCITKLRQAIGSVKASVQWLDELEGILGPGSKNKIQGWIDAGLDAQKTEAAFVNAVDKAELYNSLKTSKSIYEQRVYIKDWDNIPGVVKSQWVPNGLNTSKTNPLWNNPALDLPADEAANFVSAIAIEFPPGTRLYRVTGGNKAGAYWTTTPPTSLGDVIGGTAVQPKWNSFESIYVYEVPRNTTLKAWKGPASSQPLDPSVSNPHLPGGTEQVFIPEILRDDNFAKFVNPIPMPW